jgi:hypothetical protein
MCGFLLRATTTNWTMFATGGARLPPPSIAFSGTLTSAEVVITAVDGRRFRFQSADVLQTMSNDNEFPYVIMGSLNSTVVLSLQDTGRLAPGVVPGNVVTISNSQPFTMVDSLLIRLTSPTRCCQSLILLDNIRLAE